MGTLKQLYSVVIGLALTQAILTLVTSAESDNIVNYSVLPWFLAFAATVIPFHHGALRHLDDTYIFGEERHGNFVFLVDYLILFAQAALMFLLAVVVNEPQSFLYIFVLLLLIDIVWASMAHFLTDSFEEVKTWAIINVVTVILVALVYWTPMLDAAEPGYLVVLAFLRTVADYGFDWEHYFPYE